ncbi:hypothetical protein GUJ93_ZPchr0002g23611 [Zizania palustris]|uniref:Uncharacterized protein n=1 Tax=Zizania palustris TaxID=103762 RepID=A0A8J5S7D7_ZIZPA|nr:hypothetical protein GUJ93_ZPchr0002g23611 [Zizania palustris]
MNRCTHRGPRGSQPPTPPDFSAREPIATGQLAAQHVVADSEADTEQLGEHGRTRHFLLENAVFYDPLALGISSSAVGCCRKRVLSSGRSLAATGEATTAMSA